MSSAFIGTSGFTYRHWKEVFYPRDVPQREWLRYYAERFNTVEINATFYGRFARDVFVGWREKTPDGFCFTLKGSRIITHRKRLQDVESDLEDFWERARGLGAKLSVALWQFPSSFRHHAETLRQVTDFAALLPKDVRQVMEFRHKSWFQETVFDLLHARNIGWVVNDSSRFPARETVTADFMYVRFHGPARLYASSYSAKQLEAWADKIGEHLKRGDVYAYFNNDFEGHAIRNAAALREMVKAPS